LSRKIICLGFQKTGTTSLAAALRRLGYTVGDALTRLNKEINWQGKDVDAQIAALTLEIAGGLEAIQDSPCAFMHREFDAAFARTKFILTTRDTDDWLRSYQRYFPDGNNPLRRWMYGVRRFSGNEDKYRRIYDDKNAEIIEYFRNRPDDFLILDLFKGDGWLELANFLGKDMLKPFPHKNKSKG